MRSNFISILILFFTFLIWLAPLQPEAAEDLMVSAAISLKDSFEEIAREFEKSHPGIKVLFNFGASGDLAKQIEAGAPVDVFASAALKDMEELDRQGLIRPASQRNFAANTLVLVVPHSSPIRVNSFQDLRDSRIQKIALGNPQTSPAGKYTQEVLTRLHLWDTLKSKIIPAENVRQVLDYVARGEVDAGLVYSTDARTRKDKIQTVSTAPEVSHQPILYPIGIVRGTKKEKIAFDFVSLILSRKGQALLKRYGFMGPLEKPK